MKLKLYSAILALLLILLAVPIFAQNSNKNLPVFNPKTYGYSPDIIRIKYLQLLSSPGEEYPVGCAPEEEGMIVYNRNKRSLSVCTGTEWVKIVRDMTTEESRELKAMIQKEVQKARRKP
jgi:hypothetical protein